MSEVRMVAVTGRGPVPIEPAPHATGLHDAFDEHSGGVYSGLRTFEHVRFLRLDLHMARTHRSTLASGWADFDEELLRRALHEVAVSSPWPDARVRFDVLPEPIEHGGGTSRLLICTAPLEPVPARLLREGVRVGLARGLRRDRPLVKTSAFVVRRRPWESRRSEAYEHLMIDEEGRLLEGISSNFYGVVGDTLRTSGGGVLEGVTRAILLELAAELELRVELDAVRLDELPSFDEAFLSSSTRALVPIVAVGDTRVGKGRPGPVTARLLAAYESYAEREARPAVPWPD